WNHALEPRVGTARVSKRTRAPRVSKGTRRSSQSLRFRIIHSPPAWPTDHGWGDVKMRKRGPCLGRVVRLLTRAAPVRLFTRAVPQRVPNPTENPASQQ